MEPEFCNRFLLLGGRPWAKPRRRFYVLLDQLEINDNGRHSLLYSAVDAEWFDREWPGETEERTALLDRMPIFLIGLKLSTRGVLGLAAPGTKQLPEIDIETIFPPPQVGHLGAVGEDLEQRWQEIQIATTGGGLAADLYRNLFAEAVPIRLSAISDPSPAVVALLKQTNPLLNRKDASDTEIDTALANISGSASIDHVTMLDVGQGGANALVTATGDVAAYFDFGGGAGPHATSFPTALTRFCFCATSGPPIILSHWDHDHWSSEGRDTRSHSKTWLVPHQTPLGLHHAALIASILRHGTLVVWPRAGKKASHAVGQLTLLQCSGSSRNSSGLAAIVSPPAGVAALPVLLPADAGYGDVPMAVGQTFDAIAAPHHGGHSNSPLIPAPASTFARLGYSYGASNSYGHAFNTVRVAHDGVGWLDPKCGSLPTYVLNTEDRNPSTNLGHIGFNWGVSPRPGAPTCSPGCTTELAIQQW